MLLETQHPYRATEVSSAVAVIDSSGVVWHIDMLCILGSLRFMRCTNPSLQQALPSQNGAELYNIPARSLRRLVWSLCLRVCLYIHLREFAHLPPAQ